MPRRLAIALLLIGCFASSLSSAQQLSFKDPSVTDFRRVLANLPADEANAIQQTAETVFPVFVFLPGIMGSKLYKTLPNGKEKLIWGEYEGIFADPDQDLIYSETDHVRADVLAEYYAFKQSVDIYGTAIQTIKYLDLSSGDNLRLFAYDWRQPNSKSAQDFSSWLCAIRSTIGDRPIVFLAHSMGGLVLKYWLKHKYPSDGCGDNDTRFSNWIKIRKIIFVGTPNYGSPKAITAFADRYYLMVDPDTLKGKLFGGIDGATLSKSINLFGATFPSAYELLPIVNTTDCFQDPQWRHPIEIRQPDGSSHSNIDLFNASTWQLFNWPKSLSGAIDRQLFMRERLPVLLASAKAFLCDIARFEPDDKFDVTRIYGNKYPTVCKIIIIQPASPKEVATIETKNCEHPDKGDGTVPTWIASEAEWSQADKIRSAANMHVALLGSPEFIDYLRHYRNELHRDLQHTYKRKFGSVDGLVNMYARLGYIVPPISTADVNDPSLQIAREVIAKLSIDLNKVYAAAKRVPDPILRADAYRVFAGVARPDDTKRAWALNNAAHILLGRSDFAAALDLGKSALQAADSSASETKAVKGRASLTAAIASQKLGDFDDAKSFGEMAVEYGNPRGQRFLVYAPGGGS